MACAAARARWRQILQLRNDRGGLRDDVLRHWRVILDGFRHGQAVERRGTRVMPDFVVQRGERLLHGGKARMLGTAGRQLQRQARQCGVEQFLTPLDARQRRMRECEPQRLEGEREPRDVEVAGRQHFAGIGQHERTVGGAVQLELDVIARGAKRRQSRAMDLRHAAQRQRILHAPGGGGCPGVLPASNDLSRAAISFCPGAGACLRGSSGLQVGAKTLER